MKKTFWCVGILLATTVGLHAARPTLENPASVLRLHPMQDVTDAVVALLDKAVSAHSQGDKAGTVQALQSSTAALETEAKSSSGSLKDKLLGQAGNLKKLIPLAQTGLLKGNILQKAVGLVKMALGAQQVEKLMGGSSLLSSVTGLSKNLNLVKTGLSVLGGSTASTGNSLISKALTGLSGLKSGGATATAAEPAVRSQLSSVLNLVKGVI